MPRLALTPRSSDDHFPSIDPVRPPPRKLTLARLPAMRAFSSDPVADRDLQPVVASLGDAEPHGHFGRLPLQAGHVDVHEIEQLEAIEPPLALDDAAALEGIARTERQLPPDHLFADARLAGNRQRPEDRGGPGLRGHRQHDVPAVRGFGLEDRDPRVRIALFLQRGAGQLAGAIDGGAGPDGSGGQPELTQHPGADHVRQHLQAERLDRGDVDRQALDDVKCNRRLFRRRHLDVVRVDAGLGEAVLVVVGLDPAQVVGEAGAGEIDLPSPRPARGRSHRQRRAQLRHDGWADAGEVDAGDADAARDGRIGRPGR